MLSEDTIFREVRGNKLFSKRLLTKTNRVPKWGERFIGSPVVRIVEESVVDPKAKTLTTYTRNLGYTKVMVRIAVICLKKSVEEKLVIPGVVEVAEADFEVKKRRNPSCFCS